MNGPFKVGKLNGRYFVTGPTLIGMHFMGDKETNEVYASILNQTYKLGYEDGYREAHGMGWF